MTTDYLELRNHLEERLTQFGHEMPGPTLAPRLRAAHAFPAALRRRRAGRVEVCPAGRALSTPRAFEKEFRLEPGHILWREPIRTQHVGQDAHDRCA